MCIRDSGKIDTKKIMGNVFWPDPLVLKEVGDRLVGGVTAGPTSGDSTEPAAEAYVGEVEAAYPEMAPLAASVFVYHYYIATEALALAMEEVNGDISGGQKALQKALAGVTFDAAYGNIALDENLSAISNNYVQQIVKDTNGDGTPDPKTIRVLTDVDQQFGGLFSEDAPAPDRENPKCVKGSEPEWVGNAEKVG